MTPVEYEGQLTADDVVAAAVLVLRRRRSGGLVQITNFAYWMLLGMMFVLAHGWVRLLPFLLAALGFVSLGLKRRAIMTETRQLHTKYPALRSRFRSRFDDTGFRTKGDSFEDFRTWQAFGAWEETPDYLLVYEAEGEFPRIIPKRLFTDKADLDSLRTSLSAHIPEPGSHRSLGD